MFIDLSKATLYRLCAYLVLMFGLRYYFYPHLFTWHTVYEYVNQGKMTGPEPFRPHGPYVRSFDWHGQDFGKLSASIDYVKVHAPRTPPDMFYMAPEFGINVNILFHLKQPEEMFVCINPRIVEVCIQAQTCKIQTPNGTIVESTYPSCVKIGCVDLYLVPHFRIFQKRRACSVITYFEEHSYHGGIGPNTRRVSGFYA
jgi:hypothetical protein